jgi:diaminohydroxyphosphoribosylaminopyrimidine deaminase/5-amino-6-(5-phosphoribosylamino)uracil reductase
LNPNAKLFATAARVPVLVVREGAALPQDRDLAAAGAEVIECPGHGIAPVLERLAARGITRLLVEGGPAVWKTFAQAGLVDEVALFMAGQPSQERAAAALQRHLGPLALQPSDRRPAGSDTMLLLRRTAASAT